MDTRDLTVKPSPTPSVNPPRITHLTRGLSNERWEMVGEGYFDYHGDPTRDGFFYQLVDHEPSGEYGVIIGGPCKLPPREEPEAVLADPLDVLAETIARSRVVGELTAALTTAATEANFNGNHDGCVLLRQLIEGAIARAPLAECRTTPLSFQIIESAPAVRIA